MTQEFIDNSIGSFKIRENDRALRAIDLIRERKYADAILLLTEAKEYAAVVREYELIIDVEMVQHD